MSIPPGQALTEPIVQRDPGDETDTFTLEDALLLEYRAVMEEIQQRPATARLLREVASKIRRCL